MIIVLFGQPHSGKTTLAKELQEVLFIEKGIHTPIVDGDDIREIFKNKDYSKEGRLKNLARISDIATFLSYHYEYVIVSAVYPILESREYLNSINPKNSILWTYLTYKKERGREKFHVEDYDYPIPWEEDYISINTDELSPPQCVSKIKLAFQYLKLNQVKK